MRVSIHGNPANSSVLKFVDRELSVKILISKWKLTYTEFKYIYVDSSCNRILLSMRKSKRQKWIKNCCFVKVVVTAVMVVTVVTVVMVFIHTYIYVYWNTITSIEFVSVSVFFSFFLSFLCNTRPALLTQIQPKVALCETFLATELEKATTVYIYILTCCIILTNLILLVTVNNSTQCVRCSQLLLIDTFNVFFGHLKL